MATPPSPAPDRPRRLVIHIGDHKTGSTSVQYAFAQKAVTLEGQTVFYPTKLSHNYLRKPVKALAAEAPPKKRAAAEYFPEPELRSLQLTASLVAELLQTPSIDWAGELRTQRLATLEQETGAAG